MKIKRTKKNKRTKIIEFEISKEIAATLFDEQFFALWTRDQLVKECIRLNNVLEKALEN